MISSLGFDRAGRPHILQQGGFLWNPPSGLFCDCCVFVTVSAGHAFWSTVLIIQSVAHGRFCCCRSCLRTSSSANPAHGSRKSLGPTLGDQEEGIQELHVRI